MAKVALVACSEYDQPAVDAAIERGIELLGGLDVFAKNGEKILLKPNLLFGDPPEKYSNTHPVFFRAVVSAFKKSGATVVYGDHPGFGSPIGAAKRAGLHEVAEEMGIEFADFQNGRDIPVEGSDLLTKVPIAVGVLESDGVISLPKLKTHGLEKLTGGVKNQFGCVPGLTKARFHVVFPDANDFARMLLVVNRIVSPRLYIMDGIIGMDGNGPRGGNPCPMGVILLSTDPIALDATVCRMIAIQPDYIPTIRFGGEQGAGTWKEEEIELVGDPLDRFIRPSFVIDRSPLRPFREGGAFKLEANLLVPKPKIDPEKCIRCGVCVTACPADPKALFWKTDENGTELRSEPPEYNYDNCIRCYCCQEMCPESAVYLKKTVVRKLFDLFG